jgi:hypothetical protein
MEDEKKELILYIIMFMVCLVGFFVLKNRPLYSIEDAYMTGFAAAMVLSIGVFIYLPDIVKIMKKEKDKK